MIIAMKQLEVIESYIEFLGEINLLNRNKKTLHNPTTMTELVILYLKNLINARKNK